MSATKIMQYARDIAIARTTWGGSQNFLGARWVENVVNKSPVPIRKRVALGMLSLSPHYFYDRDVRAEDERNRLSRQVLADALVAPYVSKTAQVIDYGCGPGYMASAVADKVDHVYATDISAGVLACARVLNARPNITYLEPHQLREWTKAVDLAYSFAVMQHLRTDALVDVLNLLAEVLRPGGLLLLHFAESGEVGWRKEAEWTANRSLASRTKLLYGLNCFARSADEMNTLVRDSGFTDVAIRSLGESMSIPCDDDIVAQHWLTARRP